MTPTLHIASAHQLYSECEVEPRFKESCFTWNISAHGLTYQRSMSVVFHVEHLGSRPHIQRSMSVVFHGTYRLMASHIRDRVSRGTFFITTLHSSSRDFSPNLTRDLKLRGRPQSPSLY